MKEVIMRFEGSSDELKNKISESAKAADKDIIIDDSKKGRFNIGFRRLGHSSGQWYVAEITEKNGSVELTGKIKDIDNNTYDNKLLAMIDEAVCSVIAKLLIYAILLLIPLVVWLLLFKTAHIYVPLLIPLPIYACLRIQAEREKKTAIREFVRFMEEDVHCGLLCEAKR